MNIGIIYNSFANKDLLPEEKELRDTGLAVGRHLVKLGYNVQFFDMDSPQDIEKLCCSDIEVAFDTSERVRGDSRGEAYAAALLEFLGIPHSRTSAFHIALGINKIRIKHILAYHGITIPRFQVFSNEEERLNPDLKYPLFVKGVATENSIGIDEHSVVTNRKQLNDKVRQIITDLKQPALVEEFIGGREFAVAILPGKVNRTMPILEIEFDALPPNRRYLDYDAKWITQSDRYQKTTPVHPENLTDEEITHINETAMRCFTSLGLDSYARVDMRYDDHTLYILEVNQNPSIGEDGSGFVRTALDFGLDYTAMINALMQNAILGAV
jgi:D-alanine-D-alanine ligase